MQSEPLPFDVTPSALLPAPFKTLIRPIEPVLLRHFLPDTLCRSYTASDPLGATAQQFTADMLRHLDISYNVEPSDIERIPKTGACVVVANHPFGLLEGFILVTLLEKVRPDYRIVANTLLASTRALHERVIFVNPFEEASAHENGKSLRASIECLRKGGLLVMFPAGEVAHFNWSQRAVADPKWNTSAARLARKIGCPTLPLFFKGANSIPFHMLGTLHPRFRTLNLARELVNKRRHIIDVRVGTPIAASVLNGYPDAESATGYLRARTYLLHNRPAASKPLTILPGPKMNRKIADPSPVSATAAEVASLHPAQLLAVNEDFKVFLADAAQIPHILHEIGRCREQTYREIGEGTGNHLDLDEFDAYYRHMFLWSIQDQRVAGAYRLVTTPQVLAERGIKGLYTSTLFHYDRDFFNHIGPAIELGRSFIRREYQKHYAPLLLLWKGIAKVAQLHPDCPVLFGAVSISSDYQSLSRTLIVNFLNGHIANNIAGWVKPRRGFRGPKFIPKHVHDLTHLLMNVEELSSSIQDLERDGKGLPVLIRQYLKIGGKLLGFNVDPNFSNALDALVMADLRTASPAMLDRCMGRAGAAEFRAFHAHPALPPTV
jgi:putative hemolysin